MNTTARSSAGVIQNAVEAAPPHWYRNCFLGQDGIQVTTVVPGLIAHRFLCAGTL
jgi:hypothetical protein